MSNKNARRRPECAEQVEAAAVLVFPLWRVTSEVDALARVLVRLSPFDAAQTLRRLVEYRTARARAAGAAQADVETFARDWVGYVRAAVARTLADSAKQNT